MLGVCGLQYCCATTRPLKCSGAMRLSPLEIRAIRDPDPVLDAIAESNRKGRGL